MDIFDVIRMDNRELRDELDQILTETENEPRREEEPGSFQRFIWDLLSVENAKHRILFERLSEIEEFSEDAEQLDEQKQDVIGVIEEMDALEPRDHEWPEFLASLAAALKTKWAYERELMDRLERYLPRQERGQMVNAYERLREAVIEGSPFQYRDRPFPVSPRHSDYTEWT